MEGVGGAKYMEAATLESKFGIGGDTQVGGGTAQAHPPMPADFSQGI
jgi:hypothetical protein